MSDDNTPDNEAGIEAEANAPEGGTTKELEGRVAAAAPDLQNLLDGLNEVLIGKEETTRRVVVGMLAGGHMLLEGLPGLGKTELVKGLSRLCDVGHRRIQFTPDLLPGDITGNFILEEKNGHREFVFQKGPVFTNILLADEINRASPKTQSALLESMQEGTVTALGEAFELPRPFFVLATQNPIDLEGTYQLPEAQLDRFLMKLHLDRPAPSVLSKIVSERVKGRPPELAPALSAEKLDEYMGLANDIYISRAVAEFIARLVEATHPGAEGAPETVTRHVKFGASPRAAIALASASRALALVRGAIHVGFDDVRELFFSIVNHRVILDYTARLEGVTIDKIVGDVLASISEIPRDLPEGVAL